MGARGSGPESVYRRMSAVTDHVADAALGGADAAELTRVFAQATGQTVVLLNPDLSLRSASVAGKPGDEASWDPRDHMIGSLLRALAAERRPLRVPAVPGEGALAQGCIATPIAIGDTLLGYLLVLEGAHSASGDVDLMIASYAATLFALTLAHERTTTDLGVRYQGAVVDALLSGHFLDSADARRKALSIGLPGNLPFRVGVLQIDPAKGRTHEQPRLEAMLADYAASVHGVLVVSRGWDAVTIIAEPDGRPDREAGPATNVMADLAAQIRAAGFDPAPTAGLSERTARPELAPEALRQAEHAIELGIRLGRSGQLTAYDELGIFRLLLRIGDMQQLWRFADDILGPALEYETNHKLDLIKTLSAYLTQHASLKQTARVLRVHANTVAYRIQRIEALTALDLSNAEDRLVAHVSVKIVESLRAGDATP